MKALVQRVKRAAVTVETQVVGEIGPGLLIFLGVHKQDTPSDTVWLVEKISGLRIFRDDNDKMNLSLKEIGGSALVVSQFTLYGTCTSGRRPEFTAATTGPHAQALYDKFVTEMRERIAHVESGIFGASMQVDLLNDGPVTLMVEKICG